MDTNTNRFRMAKQVSDQTRRITYFGRITEINDEFIKLQDVFYLQFKKWHN